MIVVRDARLPISVEKSAGWALSASVSSGGGDGGPPVGVSPTGSPLAGGRRGAAGRRCLRVVVAVETSAGWYTDAAFGVSAGGTWLPPLRQVGIPAKRRRTLVSRAQ